MKKTAAIIFVLLLLLTTGFNAYAADGYSVNSPDIKAKQGETVTVPLRLSGNNGLMGFRISVKYPANQIELTDVSSGSITADGLFNTTITDYYSVNGKFDVVWSDSAENKSDGTLFIMTYKVKDTASDGEYNISLSYNQEDTFNEKFNDVKLKCKDIKLYIGNVSTTSNVKEESTQNPASSKNDNKAKDKAVSDDYLISSVKQILQSFGKTNIDDLNEDEKERTVEYVNNRIDSYGEGKKYQSFDELAADYKSAIKRQASNDLIKSVDPDVIIKKSGEVLKTYNAKSYSSLPEEKKKEAVDKTLETLADDGAEEKEFNNMNSYDEAAQALDSAVEAAKNEVNKTAVPGKVDKNKENKGNNKTVLIIIICIAAAAAVCAIAAVVLKRRKRNEK